MAARCGVLRAEHVYAFGVGDLRRHCHVHLAPRFPHTPERLRDRRCFEGRPEDMLPERVVISAAARVAAMVRAAAP